MFKQIKYSQNEVKKNIPVLIQKIEKLLDEISELDAFQDQAWSILNYCYNKAGEDAPSGRQYKASQLADLGDAIYAAKENFKNGYLNDLYEYEDLSDMDLMDDGVTEEQIKIIQRGRKHAGFEPSEIK